MGRRRRNGAQRALAAAVVAATLAAAVAGCGHGGSPGGGGPPSGSAPAPAGPSAELSGPITQGAIIEPTALNGASLTAKGYVEQEYFASGTASAYATVGGTPGDGRWKVRTTTTAGFTTRIVVRKPSDAAKFNGTVVVEWLNVSGGLEAAPEWTYMSSELLRGGYAYVAVSAQRLGIDGGVGIVQFPGVPASKGLVGEEPKRYGSLVHPGDQYSYDIFTQIARALRHPQGADAFAGLDVKRILAVGESQSAFYLTTYVDAIAPVARAFDGYFIHSRGLGGMPVGNGSMISALTGTPLRIRTDLDVPVFVLETESDVGIPLNYEAAAQPDTDLFRLWEVAGTSHADETLVDGLGPAAGCAAPVNDGPDRFVVRAAIHALNAWVADGTPPPSPPLFTFSSMHPPTIARDNLGIALGGVRTPLVDVPAEVLSGVVPAGSNLLCTLFGSTEPLSAEEIAALYPSKSAYVAKFTQSLDGAIRAGYVLPADRAELLAIAAKAPLPA